MKVKVDNVLVEASKVSRTVWDTREQAEKLAKLVREHGGSAQVYAPQDVGCDGFVVHATK